MVQMFPSNDRLYSNEIYTRLSSTFVHIISVTEADQLQDLQDLDQVASEKPSE